jgi:predicted transposase YbfD/YdcC
MEKSAVLLKLLEFTGVDDPRLERKKLYALKEVLFLMVSSVISGCQSWEEIADFGEDKLAWLRQYLPYSNGTPSHDTVDRVMSMIDHRAFESFFIDWACSLRSTWAGLHVAIDGKKLRASADKLEQQTPLSAGGKSPVHLVEAWCGEMNLCLGQYKTEDKSNEITAIPALLDLLEISGCVITVDAMGCQKKIAEKIVGRGADYVFGLKKNQESLFDAVSDLFAQVEPGSAQVFEEGVSGKYKHGRIEQRLCRTLPAELLGETCRQEWKGLNTLIEIQSERLVNASGQFSFEKRYYISSCQASPERFNQIIRAHWGIENNLHWTMDVTFAEDKARKRKDFAPQNFALFRRIALNLLQQNPDKISLNRKMAKCARSDEYREKTLNFNA